MIPGAVASLLIVAAQNPPAGNGAAVERPENGTVTQAERMPSGGAEQLAEEPPAEPRSVSNATDAEQAESRICRRQSYFDDFGRQRSRRICRPRDD